MKKKMFTRPISVMLPVDMFEQIRSITDHGNIGFSDYVREALQDKLKTFHKTKTRMNHFRRI